MNWYILCLIEIYFIVLTNPTWSWLVLILEKGLSVELESSTGGFSRRSDSRVYDHHVTNPKNPKFLHKKLQWMQLLEFDFVASKSSADFLGVQDFTLLISLINSRPNCIQIVSKLRELLMATAHQYLLLSLTPFNSFLIKIICIVISSWQGTLNS